MTKPGIRRPLVIPMHARDVPVAIILNNLRTAGISREDYLRVLTDPRRRKMLGTLDLRPLDPSAISYTIESSGER